MNENVKKLIKDVGQQTYDDKIVLLLEDYIKQIKSGDDDLCLIVASSEKESGRFDLVGLNAHTELLANIVHQIIERHPEVGALLTMNKLSELRKKS